MAVIAISLKFRVKFMNFKKESHRLSSVRNLPNHRKSQNGKIWNQESNSKLKKKKKTEYLFRFLRAEIFRNIWSRH